MGNYNGQHDDTTPKELELWDRVGSIMEKANKGLKTSGDENLWTEVGSPLVELTMGPQDSLFEMVRVYVRASSFPKSLVFYPPPFLSFLSASLYNITNMDAV